MAFSPVSISCLHSSPVSRQFQDIKYNIQFKQQFSDPSRFYFTVLVMFLGKASEIVGYIFNSTKAVELRRPTARLQGLLGLLALFLSIFGIHLTSSMAFNIANFFQICSTLAAFEELDGGFEPTRNGEICWINNNTSFVVDDGFVVTMLGSLYSCCHFSTCLACEPQTYFRSSLLSLRLKLEPKKPDSLAGVYVTSLGKCGPRFAGSVKNVLGSAHKLKKIEI